MRRAVKGERTMAQKRVELRFSPTSPAERALIDALAAQGDEYGAKGRFLKERLVRGHGVLRNELGALLAQANPLAALDGRAGVIGSGHYRALKVMLIASAPWTASQPSTPQIPGERLVAQAAEAMKEIS